MNKMTVSLFTRTPLHVGCGSAVGAVDLPVLRERATAYPVIPGSTFKGVLADIFLEAQGGKLVRTSEGTLLLGNTDTKNATRGSLLVGELRLAAFPVRSAKKGFAWVTSPVLLARLGYSFEQKLGEMDAYGSENVAFGDAFVLEEYKLSRKGDLPEGLCEKLAPLCSNKLWVNSLKERLVIVSDTMLSYFAENACEIAHHNRINDNSGIVDNGALFSQENVPSETLFVGEIMARNPGDLKKLQEKIAAEGNLLQVGADATTGLGWCDVTLRDVK